MQSLTLAPSLSSGVVVWEDSPLLRAVKAGRCLVVDEADKAPLEVVCVLKALSEDGELSLPDGRTVVRENDARFAEAADEVEKMSSDFRLLVLANRPGYPFMGNDFFKVCGDVFSCHVVDNPDIASEVELLKSVGPDVPKNRIIQLSLLFAELRELVASGQLAYPYSTRELVKLVSHAQRFPRDSLEEVAAGVFAFDIADTKKRKPLLEVLQRHGIATTKVGVRLLEGRKNQGNLTLRLDENRDKSKDVTNQDNPDGERPPDMAEGGPKHSEWDGQQHIGGNRFAGGSGGTGTAGQRQKLFAVRDCNLRRCGTGCNDRMAKSARIEDLEVAGGLTDWMWVKSWCRSPRTRSRAWMRPLSEKLSKWRTKPTKRGMAAWRCASL